uniref:Ubiquitin carboxyl-terminal hydrolase 36 n=1 Tax=Catharus ustulatus TaxID=91951 RepID=A0A8C3UYT8_CATUS
TPGSRGKGKQPEAQKSTWICWIYPLDPSPASLPFSGRAPYPSVPPELGSPRLDTGMTPPRKTLFPPEKICMDWRQKRRPGAGLHNLGSTCYLNVILQCLTYTAPLANYLLSRHHSRFCRQQGFCMMCIMEAHVRKVLYSSAAAIRPRAVIRDLKCKQCFNRPDFPGDAYEFLRCTVNAMQRACLTGSRE